MCQFPGVCGAVFLAVHIGLSGLASAVPYKEMDPKNLTADQQELLNYAYLPMRLKLLPAIKATGDQVVVVRNARMGIIYRLSLQRTREGEAIIHSARPTSPGMVKMILADLAPVREALSEEQRQAFAQLMAEQRLQPITVESTTQHFLLRYTFGPDDRVEKAKTPEGDILDVVVPEKEDLKQWYTELKTGDELVRLMENPLLRVHPPVGDFLVRRGAASLDEASKKRLAEMLLTGVENDASGMDPGYAMQAYSTVAQPEHEQRVFVQLDKCSIHHVAGMVAAYSAVAPAQALDYIAKPPTDKNYPIRAIQGLGMAPDPLRLLQSARAKMPDMKWMIDQQVKAVTELQKARAEGRPENPGEAAAIRAREQRKREDEGRAQSGKKPGDYQGFDDWFADLAGSVREKRDKAADHFTSSIYAVDLSKVTPQQRAAVFKIAYEGHTAPKTTIDRDKGGKILVAAAGPENTDDLVAALHRDNHRFQYPLAALVRVNPARASQWLLDVEYQKYSIGKIREAMKLVPAAALPVLEETRPRFKSDVTRETYGQFIAECKRQTEKSQLGASREKPHDF